MLGPLRAALRGAGARAAASPASASASRRGFAAGEFLGKSILVVEGDENSSQNRDGASSSFLLLFLL